MRGQDCDRGVTSIELLVVVVIIGIMCAGMGFSYVGWLERYKVERQVKDLYSDMMSARAMALQRGRSYFAQFQSSTEYRIVEDTNEDNTNDAGAGDEVLGSFPKKVEKDVNANGSLNFRFTQKGIISPLRTVWISHDTDPDYDCLVISTTRINIGRMQDGTCVQK